MFTIGHSTRPFDDFVAMLKAHGVVTLADVRTVPKSRRVPQFNDDALAETLPGRDIEYLPMRGLGGLRKPRPDSINSGWRNTSFRGYADYMQTEPFREALGRLIEVASTRPTAIMCAEAVPWRCHRSLVADAMTARGWAVLNIMSATSATPHRVTPFARVEGERVTYPPDGQPQLFD